jgi:3-hydroxybutyryl-CoA dehydrogenase
MRKEPIVVKDVPGFASSRLGVALGLEAMRMFEQGVASVQDIDTAMELGYNHPMGPLKLTDLVGPRRAIEHRRVSSSRAWLRNVSTT